jgi:hypothetical protein
MGKTLEALRMVWLAKSSVILLMGVGGGARKKMLDFVVMHEKGRCVRCDALCPWG